jgi:hypothetical protein
MATLIRTLLDHARPLAPIKTIMELRNEITWHTFPTSSEHVTTFLKYSRRKISTPSKNN